MALIWGTNYSIVKFAFLEMDPQAFNAIRMVIASVVFLGIIFGLRPGSRSGPRQPGGASPQRNRDYGAQRDISRLTPLLRGEETSADSGPSVHSIFHTPEPLTRRDWLTLAGLGVVGHFCYQFLFIGGPGADQRGKQFTDAGRHAGGDCAGECGAGAGAHQPAALVRRGTVRPRNLHRHRPGHDAGERYAARRSVHVRGGVLLGDLHARCRATHAPPFAGRRDWTVDGDRDAHLRARDAAAAAGGRLGGSGPAGRGPRSCTRRFSRCAWPTRSGT
jgi:hypothetical protein